MLYKEGKNEKNHRGGINKWKKIRKNRNQSWKNEINEEWEKIVNEKNRKEIKKRKVKEK